MSLQQSSTGGSFVPDFSHPVSIGVMKSLLVTVAVVSMLADSTVAQPPAQRPERITVEMPVIPSSPLAKDADEKRILEVLDDLNQTQRRGNMNVPVDDGRLLRLLVESTGAKRVVEIGTSNGYSGIWICLALKKTGGQLITHDIDQRRIALARANFKRAGVEDLITIVEGDAHETVKQQKDPIDVLFIDADKPGYPDYLEKLLPRVRPGGLVFAHNMRRPQPDPRYIKAITTDANLDTSFVLMEGAGVGVTLKKR